MVLRASDVVNGEVCRVKPVVDYPGLNSADLNRLKPCEESNNPLMKRLTVPCCAVDALRTIDMDASLYRQETANSEEPIPPPHETPIP